MKALVRSEGETVRESDRIEGIDWNTGAPLTNPSWCGGPYTLIENYVEPSGQEPELILFDGKLCTREQLINLIKQ